MKAKNVIYGIFGTFFVIVVAFVVISFTKSIVTNQYNVNMNSINKTQQVASIKYQALCTAKQNEADKAKQQLLEKQQQEKRQEEIAKKQDTLVANTNEILNSINTLDENHTIDCQEILNSINILGADLDNTVSLNSTDDVMKSTNPEYFKALTHNKDSIYYIKSGDTLSKLSAQTHCSVDELAKYNQIHDVNLIYENSVLRVPYKYDVKSTDTDIN